MTPTQPDTNIAAAFLIKGSVYYVACSALLVLSSEVPPCFFGSYSRDVASRNELQIIIVI